MSKVSQDVLTDLSVLQSQLEACKDIVDLITESDHSVKDACLASGAQKILVIALDMLQFSIDRYSPEGDNS